MRTKTITAFAGVNSAFNARDIRENQSSGQVNARVEDGEVAARFGFKKLADPQTGFTAIYGFDHLHGYSGSSELEEYVSFENLGASVYAYYRNKDTGVAAEIKNGVASVALNASEWVSATFRDVAYFINPNNTPALIRHTIGTATSLDSISNPADPTVAPTWKIVYTTGGATSYAQFDFTGIDPSVAGEVACTGAATNTGSTLTSDGELSIRHTASTTGLSSFEVDLFDGTWGVQDFTYNDCFAFHLTWENPSLFQFDTSSVQVQISNNDGTPLVFNPTSIVRTKSFIQGGVLNGVYIFVQFDAKTRSQWDNIRYFKVSYKVTKSSATASNNDLIVSKPYIGCLYATFYQKGWFYRGLDFAYTYVYDTLSLDSGLSPTVTVSDALLYGFNPFDPSLPGLGAFVEFTMTVSGDANVDKFGLYAKGSAETEWRALGTQSDADNTYVYTIPYNELISGDAYDVDAPSPFEFSNLTNAFAYKACMVWLYKSGYQNVRFSRVGEALKQANPTIDEDEDLNRGNTLTLADNAADIPLGGIQAGDAAMVAGAQGVYVSYGDYPAQMTPFNKVAGSSGVAGKRAFARFKSDNGVTGMVYATTDGQVKFSVPGTIGGAGDEIGNTVTISDVIRDGGASVRTFLLDEQRDLGLTDFSTAQVKVNERDDCLVVVMGKRGIKLRRADLTGVRGWEPEIYNTGSTTGTIRYLASSPKYGIRWMRSTGQMDEDEFNNAAGVYVQGVNRDGGNPMPEGYWDSKVFAGENRRILRVFLERDKPFEPGYVKVFSNRVEQKYKIAENRRFAKCRPDQQGFEHRFRIVLPESDAKVGRLSWDEVPTGRALNR